MCSLRVHLARHFSTMIMEFAGTADRFPRLNLEPTMVLHLAYALTTITRLFLGSVSAAPLRPPLSAEKTTMSPAANASGGGPALAESACTAAPEGMRCPLLTQIHRIANAETIGMVPADMKLARAAPMKRACFRRAQSVGATTTFRPACVRTIGTARMEFVSNALPTLTQDSRTTRTSRAVCAETIGLGEKETARGAGTTSLPPGR